MKKVVDSIKSAGLWMRDNPRYFLSLALVYFSLGVACLPIAFSFVWTKVLTVAEICWSPFYILAGVTLGCLLIYFGLRIYRLYNQLKLTKLL